MKKSFRFLAFLLLSVVIILQIPIGTVDAVTPEVLSLSLGYVTTTAKTGQSQYRVYTSPYGLDAGYVDAGESIFVYFKEYSAGTWYYYIEFQGSYGRKRAYIPASSINEVSVASQSFPTRTTCYAKTTLPIKNGNTQWFDTRYDHTLNTGDTVSVLARVGNWFMVEHYHEGRNIRGFVDFARIDYYKINEHYTRNHSATALGAFQLKYYRHTGFQTAAAQTLASEVAALWNDCNSTQDHFTQNWSVSEVTASQVSSNNTVMLMADEYYIPDSETAGSITLDAPEGWFENYVIICINPIVMAGNASKTAKSVLAHEFGHALGLADNNDSGMLMDQNRPSSIQTPQRGDIVGVWDYYNGYYSGYTRP